MKNIIILTLGLLVIALAQETGARYLIITHDNYYNAVKPLADWKTRKGLKAKIVKLSETGGDSVQIKSYIVNAYNTWPIKPEYLLLVGNKNQIPFPRMMQHSEVCHSDNYYTNVTGNFQNEIIPGRFWVYNTDEVKTIVAKVLGYEKDPYLNDFLWFKKGVTIVNEDIGPPYSDSIYWADARYMHNLMINAGFVHIDSLSESSGHDTIDLLNAINDGRSYILFRGTGYGCWGGGFNLYYPDSMKNGFKLPIVISATCATIEGIGYLWLNGGTPEEPKGVVGFYGTTTGLMGAAEMRSALTKGTLESIFTDSLSTFGKAGEAGRLKYYELFNNTLEYDSWNCLGDPEMTMWTAIPKRIDVSHNSAVHAGSCTLFVDVQYSFNATPVESAFVCMMAKKDSTVYQYGRTDDFGHIEFITYFHFPCDSIFFTVTGRNLKPYYSFTLVQFSGGPYVVLSSYSISDTAGGNGDSIANPGENIELPLWIKNWGDSTAYNVSGVIQKTDIDSLFTLSDTVKYFGDIQALDSAFTSDGYNVIIAPNCPDTHRIELQLITKDVHDSSWISDFSFTVHAPILHFYDYHFPGFVKYINAGDTNQLIVKIQNTGSYKAENTIAKIFSDDSLFAALDSIASFGTIESGSIGSNSSNPYIITISQNTPPCYPLQLKLKVIAGVNVDTLSFTVYVGQKDYYIWDPDSNHTSGPIIKTSLDSLGFYGDYNQSTLPLNDYLSLYKSLFVCLGIWPHKHIVKDTSQAGLVIDRYISVLNGRSYMEGGDVWYDDPHYHHGYNFCQLFNILAVSNHVGPFSHASGENGTFTQSMSFFYSGENYYIDHIRPDSDGVLIFKKTDTNYDCGVAANHKTVGLSFELGGLDDGSPPSTKIVLIDSIMQYFGIPPTGIRETQISNLDIPGLAVYPNPFNQTLGIRLQGIAEKEISLKIYDVLGRCVKTFFDNQRLKSEIQNLTWDGKDNMKRKLSCGVYFVRFVVDPGGETENYKEAKKVILLK